MLKLALFAHDPGAAQMLSGILVEAHSRGHHTRFFAEGQARLIWEHAGHYVESFDQDNEPFVEDLACWSDGVIAGTGFTNFEVECYSQLKNFGIKSFAIIDSWVNFRRRFETVIHSKKWQFPDAIGVIDESCKQQLVAEDWCPSPIYIVGQPSIKLVSELVKAQRKNKGIQSEEILAFFSEPISDDFGAHLRGFDQFSVFEKLIRILTDHPRYKILVKPHPRESEARWHNLINKWNTDTRHEISMIRGTSQEILSICDYAIGMTTITLLEAAFSDIPTISLQPDRKGNFGQFLDKFIPVISRDDLMEGEISKFLTSSKLASPHIEKNKNVVKEADTRFLNAVESVFCPKECAFEVSQ